MSPTQPLEVSGHLVDIIRHTTLQDTQSRFHAWQVLDDLLLLLGGGSSTAIYNVDSCLAEVEDLLSYCNDILSAGKPACPCLLHTFC